MNKNIIFIVLLLISLAGCSTSSIKKDFNFDSKKQQGIAVFSVTHEHENIFGSLTATFLISNTNENGESLILDSTEEQFMAGWNKDSEFTDEQGRLFAVTLASGEHQLSSWYIKHGTTTYSPKKKPIPIMFNIKKNEIKYLGNFHMEITLKNNFIGIPIVDQVNPEIKDKSVRDIAVFEQRYPQFKNKITHHIIKKGSWISE